MRRASCQTLGNLEHPPLHAMIEIASHLAVAIVAIVLGSLVERYRTWLLSRLLFWQRRSDLMGTYTTIWTTETNPTTAGPPAGTPPPIEDLVRISWASGQYVTGTASNSRLGDYKLWGRAKGSAVSLVYRAKDESLGDHLGVVMLRLGEGGQLSGHWSQNRPDEQAVHQRSTVWRKRAS